MPTKPHRVVSPLPSWPRRLAAVGVLVAGTVAVVATVTAGGGRPPARASYQVIQISPDLGAVGFINNRDQVAFSETRDGVSRAALYEAGRIRPLGPLGTLGGTNAYATALNDHGQVVGASEVKPGDATTHAFRWTRGAGMTDLDPDGSADSVASAINNNGHVVGRAWFSESGQTARHAFRWSPRNGLLDLTPGASVSGAFDINDAGTVVGFVGIPNGDPEGWPWRWTQEEGLAPLTAFSSRGSGATDINAAGQITGTSVFSTGGRDHAFFWSQPSGIVDLGSGSADTSAAGRINDKGLVIGVVGDPFVAVRPMAWTRSSGLVEFAGTSDTLEGVPRDVNNAGQVVGDLDDRAFIWTRGGGVVDLNTRVKGAPPGLVLRSARSISDGGSIVAFANTGLVLLVPRGGHNAAPVAGPIMAAGALRAGTLSSFSAGFTDGDRRDAHKATWSWGDGAHGSGIVSARRGAGSVSGQHAYRAPGIHTVRLVIRDSGGRTATVERRVVVHGAGALAAGAGAFLSPANAHAAMQKNAARATFAILVDPALAQRATVRLNTAGLDFESRRIDDLSVEGGRIALRGSGSVNGKEGHDFELGAGPRPGGGHALRIRIVQRATAGAPESVLYDNLAPGGANEEGSIIERDAVLTVFGR